MDANVSNVTASTSKNTQNNDVAIKDFFQLRLGEFEGHHAIYSLFYYDLTVWLRVITLEIW